MTIYFSNRHEILLKHLKENLFVKHAGPFTKRVVIVPNADVDTYIRQNIAKDPKYKIAAGFKTTFLHSFFNGIERELDLTLRIFEEIQKIKEDPHFTKLSSYLESGEKKIMPLCAHLAKSFAKYALSQKKEKNEESWQLKLWHRLFPKGNPYDDLLQNFVPETDSLHLFGFSHLSDFHFSFFEKYPCHIYHLSPCKEFWSDIKGDREIGRELQNKEESLENYLEEILSDRNPILANYGKVGREFAKEVEERNFKVVEEYVEERGTSKLHHLQTAILNLSNESLEIEDDSIEIHSFETHLREIEGLYQKLLQEISKGLTPSECAVYAPNIDLYAPYIRAVFEKLPFHIHGCHLLDKNRLMQGVLLALNLESRKWSAESLIELLAHPLFKVHLGAYEERWIYDSNIRFGFDQAHVKKFGGELAHTDYTTWSQGFDRLLLSLATSSKIPLTKVENIQNLILTLRSLYEALKPFHDSKKRSLTEWTRLTEELAKSFFLGSEEEVTPLVEMLSELKKESTMTSDHFLFLFKSLGAKKRFTEKNSELEAVQFYSLQSMNVFPAKWSVLIGMNHGSFPRKQIAPFLEMSRNKISEEDLDKSAFLEVILTAEEKLYISHTLLPPASPVESLKGVKRVEHPLFSFDTKYFDGTHPDLVNSSEADFKAATYSFQPKKPFVKWDVKPVDAKFTGEQTLHLDELTFSFKNPLKLYFREHLKVKLQKEERDHEAQEFLLEPWQLRELQSQGLKKPLHVVVEEAMKRGAFPQYAFADVAKARFENEHLTLDTEVKEVEGEVRLEFDDNTVVIVVGSVERVTERGLFLFEKYQFKSFLRHLPAYCFLNVLKPTPIIFGKEEKEKEPYFEDPKALLKELVRYYFVCKHSPSLLFPRFAEHILKGESEKLEKALQEEAYEEELKFILRYEMLPSASEIIDAWQETAQKLFQGSWFHV